MSHTAAPCEARHGRVWLMHAPQHAGTIEALGLREPAAARALLHVDAQDVADTPRTGRAPTLRIEAGDLALHFRHARHGGWLAPLWRGGMGGFGRMRAEFIANHALHAKGAPVPEPVFALALRRGALWDVGLATVHEADALDAVAFLSAQRPAARVLQAAHAAGEALRAFHSAGARHADLNLGNILIRERPERVDALIIDLDRVRTGRPPDAARRRTELRRLVRSLRRTGLGDALGAEARAAFHASYAGAGVNGKREAAAQAGAAPR